MTKDIFVVAEQRGCRLAPVSLELTGKARELAAVTGGRVCAILPGCGVDKNAAQLIAHGADEVFAADSPLLAEYTTEPFTQVVTHVITTQQPDIVLFGATPQGRDLAPRVSARVQTGLTADCIDLTVGPGEVNGEVIPDLLKMLCPAYSGNLLATIVCAKRRPQMATVRPGVFQPLPPDVTRCGTVTKLTLELSTNVQVLETVEEPRKEPPLEEAACIVATGRGVGKAENLEAVRALARTLGGQVAVTRTCVDAGWAEEDRMVGQSGKTVRPDFYLACGLSGAIQHVTGMEHSGLVVAINQNDTAPIFDYAQLGIVGDMNAILPRLNELVQDYLAKKAAE